MKVNLFITLLLLGLIFSSATYSQEEQPINDAAVAVDQLIDILENPATRSTFINKLKSIDQQSIETKKEFDLSDTLLLGDTGEMITESVNNTFGNLNLTQSTLINSLLIAVVFVLSLTIYGLNRFFIKHLKKVIAQFNQHMKIEHDRFYGLLKIETYLVYTATLLIFAFLTLTILFPQHKDLIDSFILENLLQPAITIFLALLFFMFLWELINAAIEYATQRNNLTNNSRIITLLPIIRNIILFVLILMATLITLSEFGIDIYPLLAGAGVVGIAVGFGAQTLVKDFLTGFTIIFEDLLQIGDVVTVANRTGLVENISLRKIELRDLDGTVHTVPFGEISIVDNLTKEYSFYLMDIGVSYREDVDEVCELLKDISDELRNDDNFSDKILEDIQIFGLDKFADSAVIIKARIKTRPIEQWNVGREFNRRMKIAFDKQGIEIPFPHQTLYFGQDKKGNAPAAALDVTLLNQQSANAASS